MVSPRGARSTRALGWTRHCDADAVQVLLGQGAPLDPRAWACHDALDMAECMAFSERMRNATYSSTPRMQRDGASRVLSLLKAAKERREASGGPSMWRASLSPTRSGGPLAPGAVGDVESRPWHGAPRVFVPRVPASLRLSGVRVASPFLSKSRAKATPTCVFPMFMHHASCALPCTPTEAR